MFEDHLHIFCQSILNQLAGDATYEWFNYEQALCWNWRTYLESTHINDNRRWSMQDQLTALFAAQYGSTGYPFGGVYQYSCEFNQQVLYHNPMRLDFLRSQTK